MKTYKTQCVAFPAQVCELVCEHNGEYRLCRSRAMPMHSHLITGLFALEAACSALVDQAPGDSNGNYVLTEKFLKFEKFLDTSHGTRKCCMT